MLDSMPVINLLLLLLIITTDCYNHDVRTNGLLAVSMRFHPQPPVAG